MGMSRAMFIVDASVTIDVQYGSKFFISQKPKQWKLSRSSALRVACFDRRCHGAGVI